MVRSVDAMKFAISRRTIAVAFSLMAIGSAAAATDTAAAAATVPYGAIAVSPNTGASATARNYPSDETATAAAVAACGRTDCQVVVTFSGRGACGAMAKRTDTGYRTPWTVEYFGAWGPTRSDAEFNAMRRAGTGAVVASECNN